MTLKNEADRALVRRFGDEYTELPPPKRVAVLYDFIEVYENEGIGTKFYAERVDDAGGLRTYSDSLLQA